MVAEKKHKGALAELRASAWLLDQGYEVFRNLSQHGAIDLIARRADTGEILLIDVKTAPSRNKLEPKNGVRVLSYREGEGCTLH